MSAFVSSATQRVLHSPEIQILVFENLESKRAAQCALVCKAWTEVALGRAWSEVHGFKRLCKVLGPVATPSPTRDAKRNIISSPVSFEFTGAIRAKDRTRFTSYAKRIRKLVITETHASPEELPSDSVVVELLKSSLGPSLLPNLVTLSVRITSAKVAKLLVPFLHHSLAELHLTWDLDPAPEFGMFLEEVELRSPQLRILRVFASKHKSEVVGCLSKYTPSRTLEDFKTDLDLYPIAQLFCDLPGLQKLSSRYDTDISGDGESIPSRYLHGHGCFRTLQELEFSGKLSKASSFLLCHPNFKGLRKLSILAFGPGTAEDLRRFLLDISENCGILEQLELHCRLDSTSPNNAVTSRILDPITSLTGLSTFSFSITTLGFNFSNDDLVNLLERCSRFQRLALRYIPGRVAFGDPSSSSHRQNPTLRVLHRIAECQPDLRYLSLPLDDQSTGVEPPFLDAATLPFGELAVLDVGDSDLNDADTASLYLSQVVPTDCTIIGWSWESTKDRMPFFANLVSHHRREMLTLEQKVDTLQQNLDSCRCHPAEEKGKQNKAETPDS